ncbi:MAG: hypothetical protein LBH18_06960 [Spirochaetaceae bacterium]|nr:hypothetical protein [Spirochaetaceae bacterium]
MKYIYMPITDKVIQDFNRVGVCIETDIYCLSRNRVVKDIVCKNTPNISFSNAVSKSRLIKLDTNVHALSIREKDGLQIGSRGASRRVGFAGGHS